MAGIGSNTLRTVLKEQGWSHSKLVAELRRQAAATGETLPKTESLLTLVSRWVNNHQQPDDFYRDLLARALDRPAAQLFGEEDQTAELEAGAEPWRLARVLELSSVGAASLEAMELAVSDFARRYPSTSPATLLDPVASHYRDVSRLLEGGLPVAHRRRLVVVAGVLAGLAGNLAFDLKQRPRAEAYFTVALQAAQEAESADLGAWSLAMRSILPAYHGDPGGALAMIQQGQAFAGQAVSATRHAWLAAMEAKAYAGLGDARACFEALGQATDAIEHADPPENRLGTDFFDLPRLLAFKGTCALLLRQPQAARAALAEGLALRPLSDVKGRSLARLDLAAAHVQEREPEEAHTTTLEALAVPPQYRVGPILQRAHQIQVDLAPWSDERPVRDLADQLRAILAA